MCTGQAGSGAGQWKQGASKRVFTTAFLQIGTMTVLEDTVNKITHLVVPEVGRRVEAFSVKRNNEREIMAFSRGSSHTVKLW